ncbi:hypothetical protein N7517_006635 [Penicillium concentricum]|uniref:Uncharacterized protein n=1 Tax=Penicillium concentricum TaxID=293559 RepID=A0A9W9SCG8_9EURO|nr:uncharacterized protein N7517_006635 [Penicillium concentricum]KAJ5374629.1 hypothetical protein N7517_006635 [Penicillium concentricum]
MGHRELTPVHVPLRTSSRTPALHEPMNTQEPSRIADRRTSKAQRFFGTDISLPKEHGGWQEAPDVCRPSFIKPPNNAPRQSSGFVPFPSSSDNNLIPDHNLRVRASSPLLGHDYRSLEAAPPLPKPSKKVHHSGSSSTLFSYFSSKESSKSAKSQALQPRVRHGLSGEPQVTYTQAQDPPKESKRKIRPKIDLSVLFPKPRNPAPQTLLSPHRMVNSPSPISTVAPDSIKIDRTSGTSNSTTRRYVETPPRRSSIPKNDPHLPKHGVDNSDLPSIAESKNSEWSEQPLERTVGTSEIDLALDRYAARRSLLSRSSMYTNSREHMQPEQQHPQEPRKSSRHAHSPSRPKETHLSPASCPDPKRGRGLSTSQESWKTNESKSKSEKSLLTKKSSKSTLKNKDLRNVSMLCLSSSSEDEDDEEQPPITESKRNTNKPRRDSVATYGEYEPEVYTASTAQATTATAVRRFDRALSTSTRGSHQTEKSQPVPVARPRKVSESSNGKSSQTTRRSTQTRRSSGVPTIPDDILSQFPQQPLRSPAELKELNRRSRVIAVTRQEQDLLEAMRIRKGKVTPSLFNAQGADRRSLASGPSRDSFCGSDTSFLRLSNVFPPFDVRSEKSATQYKDGSLSQSSGSDTERKPRTAASSSGFSADYSESLPSPSTSGASPLTPTLPIHRFSPLPSPKPPPRGPPPAIPEDQKQHTRRRTDSSEAILLDGGEPKRSHDLPLWSFDFDWNQEHTNVARVH